MQPPDLRLDSMALQRNTTPGPIPPKRRWRVATRPLLGTALLFLTAAFTIMRGPLVLLWMIPNFLFGAAAVLYGLFHVRALRRAVDLVIRWGVWCALIASLDILGFIDTRTFPRGVPEADFGRWGIQQLWLVLPAAFMVVFTLSGLVGACIGALMGGRQERQDRIAAAGAAAMLAGMLALVRLRPDNPDPEGFSFTGFGLPALTAGWCLVWSWLEQPFSAFVSGAGALMAKWLVLRPRIGTWTPNLDLRGWLLGVLAGGVALALAATDLLWPLQVRTFATLQRAGSPVTSERAQRVRERRERFVLLEMDPSFRRAALTTRSEADVQAEIIRKLAPYRPLRIVLPEPYVDLLGTYPQRGGRDPKSVARSARDLPELVEAARTAPVTLERRAPSAPFPPEFEGAVPPPPSGMAVPPTLDRDVRALRRVVRESAPEELDWVSETSLAFIRPDPNSLPIDLYAAIRHMPTGVQPLGRDRLRICDLEVPKVLGGVPVSFFSPEGGDAFPHVPYSSVLRAEPLLSTSEGERPQHWAPPAEYFRNKVVFLEPLFDARQSSPVGRISPNEAMAFAVDTLYSDRFVQPMPWRAFAFLVVIAAAWVGQLCYRRDPFDAATRTAPLGLLVLLFSYIGIAVDGWLDPTIPITAIVGAYLLSTWFTSATEREEREQIREAFRRMVPAELADELIRNPDRLGLGGEMRDVCVLFADVRDFTGFTFRHSPQEVIDTINEYMTALTDGLHAHGGLLDKYTGDGLMAFFLVMDGPADIARSVRAALAMRDAVLDTSARLVAAGRPPLAIGIGLHYGPAMVGMVGHPTRLDFTALGHTVVVSARLQGIAAGGEVVVSEAVQREMWGVFRVVEREPVPVKGIAEPVRSYVVLGESSGPGSGSLASSTKSAHSITSSEL